MKSLRKQLRKTNKKLFRIFINIPYVFSKEENNLCVFFLCHRVMCIKIHPATAMEAVSLTNVESRRWFRCANKNSCATVMATRSVSTADWNDAKAMRRFDCHAAQRGFAGLFFLFLAIDIFIFLDDGTINDLT